MLKCEVRSEAKSDKADGRQDPRRYANDANFHPSASLLKYPARHRST